MRILKGALGVLLTGLGLLGSLVALLALVDPKGTQMANDADPFGTPPTMGAALAHLGIYLAVLAAGVWLWARASRRGSP